MADLHKYDKNGSKNKVIKVGKNNDTYLVIIIRGR